MEPEARKVVWDHELLDLGEETRERGWALLDQVDMLRRDVAVLARHVENREKLDDILRDMRPRYLRIEIRPIRGPEGGWQDLGGAAQPRPTGQSPDPAQQELLESWRGAGGAGLQISRIRRIPYPLTPEGRRASGDPSLAEDQYVIWGARRLDRSLMGNSGAGEQALMVALSLDDVMGKIIGSARHLGIVFQGREVVAPPVGMLRRQADARAYQQASLQLFRHGLYDPQGQIPVEFFSIPETWRLTTGRTLADVPVLKNANVTFYFCESQRIPGLEPLELRRAARALDNLNAQWVGQQWAGQDPCLRRAWGLDESRQHIRLFTSDRSQLPTLQAQALERVRAALPGRAELLATVRWQPPVPCRTCDVNYVRVDLDPGGSDRTLIIARAQFREELAADLATELAGVHHWAWMWGAAAALVALVFSLVITRPLQRITTTATALARAGVVHHAERGAWDKTVAEASANLPAGRRDEIGALAWAFRQMLEEIRARHRELWEVNLQLDARVQARTGELKDANRQLAQMIRELQETNVRLTEAHQAQRRFVSSISHDLKTPLTTVKGYCELLMQSALTDEQREDLQTIYVARERLQRLIEDIIDSQKIDLRELELDRKEFDAAALVREIGRGMLPSAAKNGNELRVECQAGIPPMYSDPDKISRVLTNLVSNACKFTKHGSITLQVGAEDRDGAAWLVVRVADTGRGIPPEHQDRIFRPFPRIIDKRENPEGTGLGLSNCKGYCEAMGGTIGFASRPGEGTTFTVELPMRLEVSARAHLPVVEQRPAASLGALSLQGSNYVVLSDRVSIPAPERNASAVLVIDDELEVRNLLKRFLEGLGYTVHLAADGAAGLRLAGELQPALVTLDAMMPDVDGWTVLRDLKSNPQTCDIPVVMITVLDDKYKGFALGASDYVTKPIDWQRLSRTLEHFRRADEASVALVVDDDPDIRALANRQLSGQGWRVVLAENGRQALDRLAAIRPSVVLLDLLMPVMDGFELLQHLRARPDWRRIPVLVVTAKDLSEAERAALNGRVVQIVHKDAIRWEALQAEIAQLVSTSLPPATLELAKENSE
jgi:signal transduction histidine kinase/DNA-binding response OmpR family regulator